MSGIARYVSADTSDPESRYFREKRNCVTLLFQLDVVEFSPRTPEAADDANFAASGLLPQKEKINFCPTQNPSSRSSIRYTESATASPYF